MKKQPDPKLRLIGDEAIWDQEAHDILTEMRAHHPDLEGAKIQLLWMLEAKHRKGQLILGVCKIADERTYRLCGVNVTIDICLPWWLSEGVERDNKCYLLDHELCHARRKLLEVKDAAGNVGFVPATDSGEEPRALLAAVDHEIEDFAAPVSRWGPQENLSRFLETAQLILPFESHAAGMGKVAKETQDGLSN